MIKKNILKTFTISVIFCAALFTGCDLFFNSKKQDNSANDYSSNNPESNIEEHEFEIEIALNPQMVEHGAIPSGNNRLQPRSTTIVPDITTIESLVITATRKKDGNGTEIESENQTPEAGNKITATANTSPQNFSLKIKKTGIWLIEVSFTMSSINYKGSETIALTTEKSYKDGVPVYAYATTFDSINENGTGTVNLVTEYEENLIASSPSIIPQSAKMKLRKRNLSTGEDAGSSYVINGIIDSTVKTVTFLREIPSGLYFAEIAFFADTEQRIPLYVCSETIIVSDGKTTDTWVISSSYLESNSGEVFRYSKNGALKIIDDEVKFIITSELVEAFAQKYEGLEYYVGGENASDYNNGSREYPFATVQKAVNTIIGTASEPGVNDMHSQYTILLKSDIKENQNTASYGSDRKYSHINLTGITATSSDTQIKITSDSEALAAYNNSSSTPKETGHGFSIDANRDADHLGSVIFVEKVILTLEKVTIRGGYNTNITSPSNNIYAGGIVLNSQKAGLILNRGACIENNVFYGTTTGAGGVALNILSADSFLIMNGGEIRNNSCKSETSGVGGVYVYGFNSGASFTMYDGKIYGNTGGKAGAIYVGYSSTFTMKGGVIGKPSSEVNQAADEYHWGNKATNGGGAIYVDVQGQILQTPANNCHAEINLEGGEICYNYSKTNGGAIFCGCSSSNNNNEKAILNLHGTNIMYNAAGITSDTGSGGAIYAQCTIINMYKGIVKGNQAGGRGGAFCVENTQASGSGAVNDNLLYIYDGLITQNLCRNTGTGTSAGLKALGGGIYLGASVQCYMQGGIIEQNKTYTTNSSSSAVSYGGAIYMESMDDHTFTTYTPDTSTRYAPHLYIEGGIINANLCDTINPGSKKRGNAVYTSPVLCRIKNKNVIRKNNDVFDFMIYIEGSSTTADLSASHSTIFIGSPVTIGNIYACDHEVTQAEYKAVTGADLSGLASSPASDEVQEFRPVERVDWYGAIVYCNKLSLLEGLEPCYSSTAVTNWNSLTYNPEDPTWGLRMESGQSLVEYDSTKNGYRLPKHEEWEYAARDGKALHNYYYAGTDVMDTTGLPGVAWYSENAVGRAHEVKKKTPNQLGLYDMNGNVYEWCMDYSLEGGTYTCHTVCGGAYSEPSNKTNNYYSSNAYYSAESTTPYGFRVFRNALPSPTTQKCTVTFDTTTNWPGNTNKVPSQIISYDGYLTEPSVDVTPKSPNNKDLATFIGWYTTPNPAQNPADPSVTPVTPIDRPFGFYDPDNPESHVYATSVTSDLKLYAVWDFVYVQGATFEGNSTLCSGVTNKESAIFIEDRVLPIGNLWVCDHEVTQSEYSTYIDFNYSSLDPVGNNYPAYLVTWYDAVIYCNLRSKAEGLTPVYYLVDSNGNEVVNGREVSTWAVVETQITRNGNKYKYNPDSDSSKLDYKGADDTDGGICFDQSANGYRLPTEAEWEYIAREGNLSDSGQTPYSGSDNINDVAWYIGNASEKSKTVKTKRANNLGIYDMSGNLREWCWDWYIEPITAYIPETGPLSSNGRSFRGGSWEVSAGYHQNNNRASNVTNYTTLNILGFRLVRNAEGPAQATPVKHTVTFDTTTNWIANPPTVAPVEVYDGKKINQPSEPSASDIHFRGWFTKPDPSTTDTAFNFTSTAIYRDLTLYAVWDSVCVPSAVFNSSTTLCYEDVDRESSVFIGGQVIPIDSLYVCDHEVTQGEYEKYCCYTGTPPSEDVYGNGADYPVYYVSWYDAIVYCNLRSIAEGLTPCYSLDGSTTTTDWSNIKTVTEGGTAKYSCSLTGIDASWNSIVCDWSANGYRLPTIAEWEYAARGGNLTSTGQTIYCGTDGTGDDLGNYAWYGVNSSNKTHPVKGRLPNALNLYDMTGNVSELCWDWHPADNTLKAVRSCGFFEAFKLNAMGSDVPYGRRNFIGFRVVRNASSRSCLVKFDTTTNWPGNTRRVSSQIIDAGDKAVAPATTNPAPTAAAAHSYFRGWFTKANPSATDTPFNFNTTAITRDLTLYAVWDFVYVEGGTVVGSNDYDNSEYNQNSSSAFPAGRTVTLSSFYICDHELTQGEYETYCCYTSSTPSQSYGVGADYPAYYVSWYDAIVYCNLRSMAEGLTPCYSLSNETDPKKWTGIKSSNGKYFCSYTSSDSTWNSINCDITASGYRLPTEAEWEYAARGGQETYGTTAFTNYFAGATTTNYSASSNSNLDPVAWYSSNSSSKTHEVKKKAPNALGLYDMSGNVCEWCWDWYSSSVGTGNENDPLGASSGSDRLLRGGSRGNNAYNCSVSYRDNAYPNGRTSSYGFRLVRSAQ